jgi:urease gamma subunit
MKTFIIDTENNIVFDPAAVSAIALEAGSLTFRTKEALMALAAEWPASRLVEIWNSFTGVRPVQRFMNRNTGVTRIWEYIQRLTGEGYEAASAQNKVALDDETGAVTVARVDTPAADTDLTERRASMKQARSADRKKRKAAKAEKAAAVPAAVGAAVQKAVRAGKSPKEVVKAAEKAIDEAGRLPGGVHTEAGPLAKAGSKGAIILELIGRRNGATLAELMTATDWQKHSVRGFIAGNAKTKLGLNVISTKDDDGSRRYTLGA